MKRRKFKPGQLITVNHIVYRCKNVYSHYRMCSGCAVSSDYYEGIITLLQAEKICERCGPDLHKIFKRI